MPQTFYVTQDEEILSIVGRLRDSELLENIFVVPKRALILQSIVNLRILAREAEKLGKSIAIITQDEGGRALVEKAGIATRSYAEESVGASASRVLSPHVPSETSIGSSEFFPGSSGPASALEEAAHVEPIVSDSTSVRKREEIPPIEYRIRVQGHPVHRAALGGDIRRPAQVHPTTASHPSAPQEPRAGAVDSRPSSKGHPSAQEKLSAFYHEEDHWKRERPRASSDSEAGHVSGRASRWLLLFAVVSVVSLGATVAFLFLPRAEISVVPLSVSQETEIEFEGSSVEASGERSVMIRVIEKEGEVSVSGTATGAASGSGEKARGKVVIYNRFGSDPQPLVATTRLESSDGKVFRLVKGVTVPGMSTVGGKQEPGAVEAEVVADETGSAYNIQPTDFSIPGFKGSAKYEKFSGKSQARMVGGASSDGESLKAVSVSDLDRVKTDAEKKFRSIFEEMVRSELSQEERFLIDSSEIILVGSPSAPAVGTVSNEFDYTAKFKGTVVIFSESALKDIADRVLRNRPSVGQDKTLYSITFSYHSVTSDFPAGKAIIKARVAAVFISTIDAEAIREEFLGKSGDEIRETLGRHPEIKKLDIVFRPKLLTSSVPKNKNRVDVRIELP